MAATQVLPESDRSILEVVCAQIRELGYPEKAEEFRNNPDSRRYIRAFVAAAFTRRKGPERAKAFLRLVEMI